MSSTATTSVEAATGRRIDARSIVISALAATAVNLIVFAVASAFGADWEAGSPYPISGVMVGAFSIIPLVAAGFIVAAIVRSKPGFQRVAAWLGLAFALVTIGGSLAMAPQVLTALSLGLMHVVVGAAWFWLAYPGRT